MTTPLEASIEHWEEIVNEPMGTIDFEADDCPLCKVYWDSLCVGCPIQKATGEQNCKGTPYEDVCLSLAEEDEVGFKRHATQMLDFLKSLTSPSPRRS